VEGLEKSEMKNILGAGACFCVCIVAVGAFVMYEMRQLGVRWRQHGQGQMQPSINEWQPALQHQLSVPEQQNGQTSVRSPG